MSGNELQHPPVQASWETRGYWEGAGRGELVLQRCADCGTTQHKPRAFCPTCQSSDVRPLVASGLGTVHTFTVTRQNQQPPFAAACPYVLAYVEVEEGPRILTHVVGCDPEAVHIGMPVEADFQPQARTDGEAFGVLRFRPRGTAA
jgi:uncharacterized protein